MRLMSGFVIVVVWWPLGVPASGAESAGGASSVPPEAAMVGVNLAGGEFGKLPGVANRDYAYPGRKQFDYCQDKGLTVIRLPLRWERVQPKLMNPLDEAELARLDAAVKLAAP
jgi:hypothetical protein